MTAEEPFHHSGRGTSLFTLRGIVPVAVVHDRDLFARRRRVGPVICGAGRVRACQVSRRGMRLQARRSRAQPRSLPSVAGTPRTACRNRVEFANRRGRVDDLSWATARRGNPGGGCRGVDRRRRAGVRFPPPPVPREDRPPAVHASRAATPWSRTCAGRRWRRARRRWRRRPERLPRRCSPTAARTRRL